MPREVEEKDEEKYLGEKKGLRHSILRKAKKLLPKRRTSGDQNGVQALRVLSMEDMDNADEDEPMRENTTAELDKEMLEIRRGIEFELIARCDRSNIDRKDECWYLMDTQWLAEWTCFVEGKQDTFPPPITSWGLLKTRDEDSTPRADLEVKVDYRGVPPIVFFVLKELYGHDKSPMLCRYTLDIYATAVTTVDRMRIQGKPMREARIMVNKCRGEWTRWDNPNEDEDEDPCCCGLRKEHIEAIIFWMVRCCSRSKAGMGNIRYRDYRTVDGKGEGDLGDDEKSLLSGKAGDDGSDDDIDEALLRRAAAMESDPERDYGNGGLYWRQFFGWV